MLTVKEVDRKIAVLVLDKRQPESEEKKAVRAAHTIVLCLINLISCFVCFA